jgi:hypothetical protein
MTRPSVPPSRLARVRSVNAKLSPEAERLVATVRTERAQAPAPKEDWALPSWITGPRAVFWMIILGAILVREFNGSLFLRKEAAKRAAVHADCITITSPPGSKPIARWSNGDGYVIGRNLNREAAAQATETCTPDDCAEQDAKRYKSALSFYLDSRLHMIDYAHKEFGPEGIGYAQEFHKTNADHNIVYGARDLIKAGRFNPATLPVEQANFLGLLILHGNDGLPVCYKPKPAP